MTRSPFWRQEARERWDRHNTKKLRELLARELRRAVRCRHEDCLAWHDARVPGVRDHPKRTVYCKREGVN